jgi:hypothetical protein
VRVGSRKMAPRLLQDCKHLESGVQRRPEFEYQDSGRQEDEDTHLQVGGSLLREDVLGNSGCRLVLSMLVALKEYILDNGACRLVLSRRNERRSVAYSRCR